jgi:hypothetical protein
VERRYLVTTSEALNETILAKRLWFIAERVDDSGRAEQQARGFFDTFSTRKKNPLPELSLFICFKK